MALGASQKMCRVTFNRIEPEGNLVIGFKKSSTASPFNQDTGFVNASNGSSTDGVDRAKKPKLGSDHQVNLVDQASPWSKDVKPEYMVEEVLGNKSTTCKKRKSSRIEKDDLIKLEFTWEQAQGLLRPALSRSLLVVVIEGIEFEEYQDAPVIGRPTINATDSMGENIQWAQCEDCLKWRKVPGDASLSSTWTCVWNSWDPERSSCSTAQELTEEQLEELLCRSNHTASENNKAATEDHQTPLNSDEKNQACLDMDCSSPNLKMRNDTSDDFNTTRSSLLPFIGQIDLNIQPESDEELSPGSDSG